MSTKPVAILRALGVLGASCLLALEFAVCAVALSCAVPCIAWAYVDPSVMTYTIQAVAGVAVALSAVAGVAMRRTRRALLRLLGIDENARKQTEPDIHRASTALTAAAPALRKGAVRAGSDAAAHSAADAQPKTWRERRKASPYFCPWYLRVLLAVLAGCLVGLTYFLLPTLEIVNGGANSLMLDLYYIAPVALKVAAVAAATCAIAQAIMPGRWFWYMFALLFALCACAWVQAMFMNTGLPSADGANVPWGDYDRIAVPTACVWALILVTCIVFAHAKPSIAKGALPLLAVALLLVQGTGALGIARNIPDHSNVSLEDYSLSPTETGLFEVSGTENVIVFVLDTIDNADLLALEQRNASFLDQFTGFTWYANCTGSLIPTRYAVPFLLTGEMPRDDENWGTYLTERYRRSNFIGDIYDAGYSIGLYSDTLRLGRLPEEEAFERVSSKVVNLHQTIGQVDERGTAKVVIKSALYRQLPWVLKPRFWYTTDWMNTTMVNTEGVSPDNTPYVMDDYAYYQKLKSIGLSVEEREATGAFRFIHLLGTHLPLNLNSQAEKVEDGLSTVGEQCEGSLRIVQHYLDQMKELGVYDDATIIITSDHGYLYNLIEHDLSYPTVPILLYKPAQSAEEAAAPLAKTDIAVEHKDIVPTVIQAVGADPAGYGGVPLLDADPSFDGPRYFLADAETEDRKYDQTIYEYEITGNVMDFDNWHKTGRTWDALTQY